uniref:Homocysteine-responsive endoplasmic reticulum-resident ubiquitin-like domain member 2 protein n=1 Tax=Romanomermis culicivorax TaxID=13658 RepID=A0A915KYZ0_ROMCU
LNNDVANAPPLNAAPAAPVDDAAAGLFAGRDFLDIIYMLLRSSIIFVVLFAYSSIERTIFVMLVVFLFFAYQNGWFARRNIPQQQQNNDDNNNRIREENNVNNDEANHVDTAMNMDQQTQPQSAWNVFWSTCYTFISSFFTSLIPERPPPINNF